MLFSDKRKTKKAGEISILERKWKEEVTWQLPKKIQKSKSEKIMLWNLAIFSGF